jgi:hypothetical protein
MYSVVLARTLALSFYTERTTIINFENVGILRREMVDFDLESYLAPWREQCPEALEAVVEPLAPAPLRDHVVQLAAGGCRRWLRSAVLVGRHAELPAAHCHVHAREE